VALWRGRYWVRLRAFWSFAVVVRSLAPVVVDGPQVQLVPLLVPTKDGLVSMPAQDEGCQPFLRRGFLLPRGTAPSPSKVGESPGAAFVDDSSQGGGLEKLGGPPGAAIDLSLCFQTLGISHEGNEKAFLDFMALIDAEHRVEALVSTPKFKGCREVKNLECTINYDARGFGSSRGKARGPLM